MDVYRALNKIIHQAIDVAQRGQILDLKEFNPHPFLRYGTASYIQETLTYRLKGAPELLVDLVFNDNNHIHTYRIQLETLKI